MLKLLPIFLFLASCTFCEGIYDQKTQYQFETFIKMKDSTQIIQKLEYDASLLNMYPQSYLVKIPLSFLKPCKIKVITNSDTGLLFVQPINKKEIILKNWCGDGVENTIFKEFEYLYSGNLSMNLIRSSSEINEKENLYTLNIDTLILE